MGLFLYWNNMNAVTSQMEAEKSLERRVLGQQESKKKNRETLEPFAQEVLSFFRDKDCFPSIKKCLDGWEQNDFNKSIYNGSIQIFGLLEEFGDPALKSAWKYALIKYCIGRNIKVSCMIPADRKK